MAAADALDVEGVDDPVAERGQRVGDREALVEAVGVDRELDVLAVGDVERAAHLLGAGADVLVDLQAAAAGAQRLLDALGPRRRGAHQQGEVDGHGLHRRPRRAQRPRRGWRRGSRSGPSPGDHRGDRPASAVSATWGESQCTWESTTPGVTIMPARIDDRGLRCRARRRCRPSCRGCRPGRSRRSRPPRTPSAARRMPSTGSRMQPADHGDLHAAALRPHAQAVALRAAPAGHDLVGRRAHRRARASPEAAVAQADRPASGIGVPPLASQRERRLQRAGRVQRAVHQAAVPADRCARRRTAPARRRPLPGANTTFTPGAIARRIPHARRRSNSQRAVGLEEVEVRGHRRPARRAVFTTRARAPARQPLGSSRLASATGGGAVGAHRRERTISRWPSAKSGSSSIVRRPARPPRRARRRAENAVGAALDLARTTGRRAPASITSSEISATASAGSGEGPAPWRRVPAPPRGRRGADPALAAAVAPCLSGRAARRASAGLRSPMPPPRYACRWVGTATTSRSGKSSREEPWPSRPSGRPARRDDPAVDRVEVRVRGGERLPSIGSREGRQGISTISSLRPAASVIPSSIDRLTRISSQFGLFRSGMPWRAGSGPAGRTGRCCPSGRRCQLGPCPRPGRAAARSPSRRPGSRGGRPPTSSFEVPGLRLGFRSTDSVVMMVPSPSVAIPPPSAMIGAT